MISTFVGLTVILRNIPIFFVSDYYFLIRVLVNYISTSRQMRFYGINIILVMLVDVHIWTIEDFQNFFEFDHDNYKMYQKFKFEELMEFDEYLAYHLAETGEQIEKKWKLELSEHHVEIPFFGDFMDVFMMMVGDYLDKHNRLEYMQLKHKE